MSKKLSCVLSLMLALMFTVLVGCGEKPKPPKPEPPKPSYSTEDTVWGAQEIADTWAGGDSPGSATLDGDIVKIKSTGPWGGVKSENFEMDFSKRVMLNFKDVSTTHMTMLIVRIRFAGYSDSESAYIIAENYDNLPNRELDYKNLNGDFSIDVADAIHLYAGDPWQAVSDTKLIYKAGDIDDNNEEIKEGDERIGKLKFEGQKVKGYMEIWCQASDKSGLTSADAYVAMGETSITSEAEAAVTSFDLNQEDMIRTEDDDTRPTKGDTPITLNPTLEVADGRTEGCIYASTNPEVVSITNEGQMSFLKPTSNIITIDAFPRANIAKLLMLKVGVQGNLKTPQQAEAHLKEITQTENVVDVTDDVISLLDSDVLVPQATKYSGKTAGMQVYSNGSLVKVLNAYDKDNATVKNAAAANGGKVTINAAKPSGLGLDGKEWKYSFYMVSAQKVIKGLQDVALGTATAANIDYTYVTNDIKITDKADYIIVWKTTDGETVHTTRFTTEVIDAGEIAKHITAKEISETFTHRKTTTVTGEDGTQSEVLGRSELIYDAALDIVKINLINSAQKYDDVVSAYFGTDEIDFKNREVAVIINVVSQVGFTNYRLMGKDAEGKNVTDLSHKYFNAVPGYNYVNVTSSGVINFEVWRYFETEAFAGVLDKVDTMALYLQPQFAAGHMNETSPYGQMVITGITWYYVD